MLSTTHDRGFTLLETVVATGILITALAGLVHLLALSVRFTRESGDAAVALVAAQDKLEALRALQYGFDDSGAAVTDARLQPSPSSSLDADTAPYVDWLDGSGAPTGGDGAVLARRWRVTPIDGRTPAAIAVEVCVFRMPSVGRGPLSADACLATVRSRQP